MCGKVTTSHPLRVAAAFSFHRRCNIGMRGGFLNPLSSFTGVSKKPTLSLILSVKASVTKLGNLGEDWDNGSINNGDRKVSLYSTNAT